MNLDSCLKEYENRDTFQARFYRSSTVVDTHPTLESIPSVSTLSSISSAAVYQETPSTIGCMFRSSILIGY